MLAETTRSQPVDRERHRERALQAVGDPAHGVDVVGVGDEHGELVAAGAGGEVVARREPQAARDGEQEPVADRRAVGVDERAEAVEVERADADPGDAARERAPRASPSVTDAPGRRASCSRTEPAGDHSRSGSSWRTTTTCDGSPSGRRASAATIRTQTITPSGRTMRASMRWVSGSPRSSRTQRSRTSGRSSAWTKSVNGRGSTRRSPRSRNSLSAGLAASTRPSSAMTATPTGACSIMASRRSVAPGRGAAPAAVRGRRSRPCGATSARRRGAARYRRPQARRARSTVPAQLRARTARRARSTDARSLRQPGDEPGRELVEGGLQSPGALGAGHAERGGRRGPQEAQARGEHVGRGGGRAPHSPVSTSATPSSCAASGAKGSARRTQPSLRKIVASRSSRAGHGLARASGPLLPPTGTRVGGGCPDRPRHAGGPRHPGIAATPPQAPAASDRTVRSRRHLPSPLRPRRSSDVAVSAAHCHCATTKGVTRLARRAWHLPVT